jgi:hypothetical protein
MISRATNPGWAKELDVARRPSALDRRRQPGIRECVDFIRRHPDSLSVGKAARCVLRILARRFPSDRFESNVTCGGLETQLVLAIRHRRPLVVAFSQRQDAPLDSWSWRTHLIEIAGVAARIDDMVPTIHAPGQGTFRASGGVLKQPLWIEGFGDTVHTWSCNGAMWRSSRVTLTYVGCYGEKQSYVRVRPLDGFLD